MKAIITLDLPDDFDINTTVAILEIADKRDNWITTAQRVKPMPQKQEMAQEPYICNNDWQNGWNDCLEEIER